jgi:archaeal flagellin FlaB
MNSKNTYDGFTGLEAAIVLIAFVVVAAVFSYVILGAGFYTTQKSDEVVHTGVQQASSTLEVVGNVYGTGSTNAAVNFINFSVALAPGGTPVDFAKVALTYSDPEHLVTLQQSPDSTAGKYPVIGSEPGIGNWSVSQVQNGNDDKLLETGEQFIISTQPVAGGIGTNTKFTVEVKPSIGAAFGITRSTPGGMNNVNILF